MDIYKFYKFRMAKQILIWLVFAALGAALIMYSTAIAELFGRSAWFEKNLWGTRNGYVLIWFGVVIIWFLILFGVIPTSSSVDSVGVIQ